MADDTGADDRLGSGMSQSLVDQSEEIKAGSMRQNAAKIEFMTPSDRNKYRQQISPDNNTACDSFSMADSVMSRHERGKQHTPRSNPFDRSSTHTKHNSSESAEAMGFGASGQLGEEGNGAYHLNDIEEVINDTESSSLVQDSGFNTSFVTAGSGTSPAQALKASRVRTQKLQVTPFQAFTEREQLGDKARDSVIGQPSRFTFGRSPSPLPHESRADELKPSQPANLATPGLKSALRSGRSPGKHNLKVAFAPVTREYVYS